jgi:hypothetical protein
MSGRIRSALAAACVVVGLARFGSVAYAQSFAADLDTSEAGGTSRTPLGHVYAADGKVRIETRQLPAGFFIVDDDRKAVWFIRPGQKIFMDARRSSPLTQTFVRVDPEDACREWQKMETIAGPAPGTGEWRCDLVGREPLLGREAVKYRTISPQNRRSTIWVDPERHFPIRVEREDGVVVSLERIVDAAQPASLFAPPDGYRRFDPMQLLEQIKQSDVWVIDKPKGGGG